MAHAYSPGERAALLAAERMGVAFLAHRDRLGDLRLTVLSQERASIGRTAGNDVVLDGDAQVSRTHARMERVGASWTLVDDGLSRNGTFVNGDKLHGPHRLADGDMLRVGRTTLLFRAPEAIIDATTAAAPDATPAVRVTDAERRVLVCLCEPLLRADGAITPASNPEIASALHLSLAGVKSHLRALSSKLGVDELPQNRKRAELARRALELGLVSNRDLAP